MNPLALMLLATLCLNASDTGSWFGKYGPVSIPIASSLAATLPRNEVAVLQSMAPECPEQCGQQKNALKSQELIG